MPAEITVKDVVVFIRNGEGKALLKNEVSPKLWSDLNQAFYPEDGEPITFAWPTEFPGVVTQHFGMNPKWYIPWGVPAHEGIDMKAHYNTDIFAAYDGIVSRVEYHKAYGNHLRIDHIINGNRFESTYSHFEKPSPLKIGDRVTKGMVVGGAGSTGNSTGPHLHFMLKQFSGELPNTEMQRKYNWPYNLIDPTQFFAELR